MTVETLSSNVVNYLVWRYLQEAGYGTAALALARSWIKDPDTLPFAKNVKPHTMINMLQDSLWFDKLSSDVGEPRRYYFGPDHGRPFALDNGSIVGKDVEPIEEPEEPEEVIEPLPEVAPRRGGKRKRKVNGVERINGDTLEVEQNGVAQVSRGVSEAVASEYESPAVEEVPIPSTLSIGQNMEIQTEKVTELAPGTTIVKVQKHDATVMRTEWSPTDSPIMITAGENLLRIHHVPSSTNAETGSLNVAWKDIGLEDMDKYTVTAFCWTSPGEAALSTLQSIANEQGERFQTGKLIHLLDGGLQTRIISSLVGTVFALRWNDMSKVLLSVSSTDVGGAIKLWKDEEAYPAFTAFSDCVILDAAWLDGRTFAVCGHNFLRVYAIEEDELKVRQTFTTDVKWEKISHDSVCDIIACASEDNVLGIIHAGDSEIKCLTLDDEHITDIQFQPIPNKAAYSSESPRLLAVSSDGGFIHVFDAKRPFEKVHRLVMGDRAAEAMAFSPDGFVLAGAGIDTVLVWNAEAGGLPRAVWKWDGSSPQWDTALSETQEYELEHHLGWDADGKKLAFTLGNQIAVINFQR